MSIILYITLQHIPQETDSHEVDQKKVQIEEFDMNWNVAILLNMQSRSREATVMQSRRGVATSVW